MRRNKQSGFVDWRKPRYHRSDPRIIKENDAKTNNAGKLITVDKNTRWKSPISRETFDDLLERGLLSKEQIATYLQKDGERSDAKKRKSADSKDKKHKNFLLVIEIAKLDLKTKEGSEAFKELLKKQPEALCLIEDAQKLRVTK